MGKKGFTLIELIGVILIVSLLILLVLPKIVNSVRNSSDDTDNLTKEMIYKASELYIANHVNDFPKTNGNKFVIKLKDLVDEKLLTSPIELSDNSDITSDKCVEITYNGKYKYELKDSGTCEKRLYCSLYDSDGDKKIDLGEEVTCGTEKFYVIPNDSSAHESTKTEGNITLLAKYNLNVGNDLVQGPLGIQNPRAIGLQGTESEGLDLSVCNHGPLSNFTDFQTNPAQNKIDSIDSYEDGNGCRGTMMFSQDNHWGDEAKEETEFIYSDKSDLYKPVQNYKTYLLNLGLDVKEASLASYEQFDEINDMSFYKNLNFTRFWLGSSVRIIVRDGLGYMVVHTIDPKGDFGTGATHNGANNGVRPVIIVSESDIIIQ